MFSTFLLVVYFSIPLMVYAAPQGGVGTGGLEGHGGLQGHGALGALQGNGALGALQGNGALEGHGGVEGHGALGTLGMLGEALHGRRDVMATDSVGGLIDGGATSGLPGNVAGALGGTTASTLVEEIQGPVDQVENLVKGMVPRGIESKDD